MSNEKETKVSTLDAKAKALANEEDEDTKIAKLLKNMPKWRFYSLAVLTVIWTVFQLYIKLVKPLDPWFQLPLHMCLALVVVWLYNPMVEKSKSHNKLWWIYDIFLIASSCFICWFFLSHAEQHNYRIFNVDVMTTTEWSVCPCSGSSASSLLIHGSASISPACSASPASASPN